jgi:polysaccharide pyruvyl transferase WcaK-like protein
MIVELKGVGFVNKGAELMLHEMIKQINSRYPNTIFTMVPGYPNSPYEKYSKYGIHPKASIWYKNKNILNFVGYVPQKIRKRFGIIVEKEINVVLDASGFAYSDQWGINQTLVMAKLCNKWKKQKTKIILLPQAFGPFSTKKIQDAIKNIADNVDLMYAREIKSYEYLTSIVGERPNIRISPDITSIIKGIDPGSKDIDSNTICIVPNIRMIDRAKNQNGNKYYDLLESSIKYLIQRKQKVTILIHEGSEDLMLAEVVMKNIGVTLPIIRYDDPLYVKGIIGKCKGIISSRYHGLVSSLSQGVPALGTGWSHKYEMLFRDYGFMDGMLDVLSSREVIEEKLDMLIDEKKVKIISEKIKEKSFFIQSKVEIMWDSVQDVIDKVI